MVLVSVKILDVRRPSADGLLHDPVEEFASVRGQATIESEREFIEVSGEMGRRYRILVSSSQPPFEKRYHQMDVG